MKKSILSIAVVAAFAAATTANATEMPVLSTNLDSTIQITVPETFSWIGSSFGGSSKTVVPGTPIAGLGIGLGNPVAALGIPAFTSPSQQLTSSISINVAHGVVMSHFSSEESTTYCAAVDASATSLNGFLLPVFKFDGVIVTPDKSLILLPNIGYGVRTGSVFGLDAMHPIENGVSLKFGVTKFNKSVATSNFFANVGIVKAF